MTTTELAIESTRELDREAQDREIERREDIEELTNEIEHELDQQDYCGAYYDEGDSHEEDERFDTANEI